MNTDTTRREFLKTSGAGAVSLAALGCQTTGTVEQKVAAQTAIPRWRGFNLLNYFQAMSDGERSDCMIKEDDCRWIADWGFDFIRIPMDYWLWIDSDWRETRELTPEDVYKIKESVLETVDRTVDLGRKYNLHVNLNFHRGPGYCINNPDREPFVLWSDQRAQDAFVFHWDVFAKRYKDIPASRLSFNLVNEAPGIREGYMSREDYTRVMTAATNKIRETSPGRPIIIDGFSAGNYIVDEMIPSKVSQSLHTYAPGIISHYKAPWSRSGMDAPEASWPSAPDGNGEVWDRNRLVEHYTSWLDMARQGIGVHVGECGSYKLLPKDVFHAWFRDILEILTPENIGYSLWEFRGEFGILNSGRPDVEYEDWQGHKLDRELLTMLQEF